ncbi:MAG: UbiD family decarboxylase [Planctomycetota bacterium]
MGYRTLKDCLDDLERHGRLRRIDVEIDPHLEAAAIHRRVFAAGGPALLFTNVKGCRFPMASNLFGTVERAKWIFRDTLKAVGHLVDLKIEPERALKNPLGYLDAVRPALSMLPRPVGSGPVLKNTCRLSELPQMTSWPNDGGPFVTLPQVYTEDPAKPGLMASNLGMYRVQLAGNDYKVDGEVGLHYQIHRSIGVHHTKALEKGEPLRVNVFVGGGPAMAVAAVMPLPEGMSELTFAGALSNRATRMAKHPLGGPRIAAEADFCISGTIEPETKPEGPFGDHLGYYAKVHDFPVLKVDAVYHRDDAVWPFTVVHRPPAEDTAFGALIHEITGPIIPTVLPGVRQVHAVDEAGVHPLLLAVGSERYTPYGEDRRPQEILTQANAILGQGQLSLAKYLMIADGKGEPGLDCDDMPAFFRHVLERVDWSRDLHFQTRTTIDTLDYSAGMRLNEGSKVVIAAAGPKRRDLPTGWTGTVPLPDGCDGIYVVAPGIAAIGGRKHAPPEGQRRDPLLRNLAASLDDPRHPLADFPLIVLCDDPAFTAESWHNFLWVTFTRSNPSADLDGGGAFYDEDDKHWGCRGSLIIDARLKPWHAAVMEEDPDVTRRVEELAGPGGPLHGLY